MKIKPRSLFVVSSLPLAICLALGPIAHGALFWDGAITGGTGDGASAGGSGTWSTAVQNWDAGNGVARVVWTNGNDAVFAGSGGTVTLGTAISAGNISISNSDYTIATASGAALTLTTGITTGGNYHQITGAGGLVLSGSAQAFNITGGLRISTAVSGSATITKTGTGFVAFNNSNTGFSGKIIVNQGSVGINSDTSLGVVPGSFMADSITLNGGTLVDGIVNGSGGGFDNGGIFTLNANRGITLGSSGGTIQVGWNGAGLLSVAGAITGTGSLTKSDSGDLALYGSNSYSGGTLITGGALSVGELVGPSSNEGSNTSLGTGSVNVSSGAQLIFAGNSLSIGNDITLNGAATVNDRQGALMGGYQDGIVTNTLTGTLTLAGAGDRTISTWWSDKAITLAGKVTGAGTLRIVNGKTDNSRGGSVVILSNTTNDFTGGIIVNSGGASGTTQILRLGASNVIPDGTSKGDVTVNGRLELGTFSDTINGLTGSGVVSTGNGAVLTVGNNNATSAFAGTMDGTGALTKTGSGMLTLSGASTFTGAVTVNGGTLVVATSGADNGSTGALGLGSGGKTITVNTGATLTGTVNNWFGNNTNAGTLPTITVDGGTLSTSRYTTIGTLTLNGATMTNASTDTNPSYQAFAFRGNVTVGGSSASTISANAATATTQGYHLGSNTTFTVADATANANADLIISAPLRDQSGDFGSAAGGLTKAGLGTLTLTGNNTFSGATNVNAGTLVFSGGGSVYNSGANAGSIIVNNGGTLKIDRQDLFGGHTSVPTATITVNSGGLVTGNANYNTLNNLTLNGGTFQTANGDGFWGSFALKGTVTAGGTSVSSTISSGGTTNNYIRIGNNTAGGATIFNVADSTGNASTDLTISAQLRDSRETNSPFNEVAGALTKNGAGTLTLSGANAYSGGTTISSGVLSADTFTAAGSNSSIGTGALTLNGGTFRYTGASTNANDTLINRTINVGANGGTLDIAASGNYFGYGGSFSGSGTLTVTGNQKELLYTGTSNGNYTGNIIVGTATANSGLVQYRSNNANAFGTGSITINAGGTFSADSGNGTPSTLGNNFFLNGGLLATQSPAMTYAGTISLMATSTIGNVATYNGTLASTGVISGSAGVIVSSGSSVTLSGNNTYSGGTTVSAGTLKLGHTSALGATSGTVNLNGGILDLNGQSVTQSAVVFNGGVEIATGGGTLTLSSTVTAISFTGTPANASATGAISLTGASGGNIIKATTSGAPVLSGALNLGGVTRTVALADTGGDLLELSLTNQVSNGGLTLDNGFNSTSTEDWGTLGLLGTNTYDGITTITKGRIVINNASSLGSTAGGTTIGTRGTLAFGGAGVTIASGITVAEALTISRNNTGGQYGNSAIQNNSGSNILSGTVSLTANATVDVVSGSSLQFSNTISQTATSSLTKIGTGTLTLSAGNSYSGGSIINAGTVAIGNNTALGGGTVTMIDGTTLANNSAGALTVGNAFTLTGAAIGVTFTGSQNLTLNGQISSAAAVKVTKSGASVLTLSGDNGDTLAGSSIWNVTGGTYNSSTGLYNNVIAITLARALGNSNSSVLNLDGGTLRFNANGGLGYVSGRTINVLAGGGAIDDGGFAFGEATAGGSAVAPTVTIANGATLSLVSSNKLVLSGVLSGSGAVSKFGTGTAILSGANTYSGGTTINAGILQIGNGGTSGSFSTSGTITNNGSLVFNRTDTVTQGANFSTAGITGTGSLTQAGSGTLVLNAPNTYSGGTSINAGTLNLTGSLANTAISVASGATFRPMQTTSAGLSSGSAGASLTLSSGGIFDMTSASAGTINTFTLNPGSNTFSGQALNFAGANLRFDLGSSSADLLQVNSGTALVTGTNNIRFNTGSSLTPGTYTLIGTTAASGLAGNFQFDGGSSLSVPAQQQIRQVGGTYYRLTLQNSATAEQVVVSAAPSNIINIMPLGSSITEGVTSQPGNTYAGGGYRSQLYQNLVNDGRFTPHFVGSQTVLDAQSNAGYNVLTGANELNHEGHSGYTTTQILKNLNANGGDGGNNGGSWLAPGNGKNPDYVTLSIGGNDYGANNTETTGPLNRSDAIVSQIASLRPDTQIILSNLFYRTQNVGGVIVGDLQNTYYNPGVQGVVFNHVLAGQHVSFYDAYSAVTPGNNTSHIFDGIHPDTVGYQAFADGWYNSLANGSAYWTGSQNGTWDTATNFAQNYQLTTPRQGALGASTDVHFNSNATPLNTTLGGNISVRSLNFAAGATGAVTIGGPDTLTLGAGGITVQAGTGAHTISSNVVLGTDQTWGNISSNPLAVTGNVSGSGNLTIVGSAVVQVPGALSGGTYTTTTQTVSGTGAFVLSGANTYTGSTTISSGTLQIGNGGTTGSLSTGSAITNNGALVFNRADTVTQGTHFSGAAITGSGSLTQAGSGTLVLNATNSYTGATAVQLGKLVVSGFIGNSAVTVTGTNTTLASGTTGTIGSSVTINSGAILAAGDSGAFGTATVTGATSLNNGSIFSWDISSNGSSYDKLVTNNLAGEVTPGDAIFRIVAADSSFSDAFWSTSRNWPDIFTTNGTTPISSWANLFSVAVVNSSFGDITPVNGSFSITGSTLTWTAVPEASNVLIGSLLGLGLLRRRREKGVSDGSSSARA